MTPQFIVIAEISENVIKGSLALSNFELLWSSQVELLLLHLIA